MLTFTMFCIVRAQAQQLQAQKVLLRPGATSNILLLACVTQSFVAS